MILSLSLVSPDFLAEIIQVKYFTILANQGQPIGVTTEKCCYTTYAGLCV